MNLLPKNSYFTDPVLNYDEASEGCEFCCVEKESSCWLGWGEDLMDSGEVHWFRTCPPERMLSNALFYELMFCSILLTMFCSLNPKHLFFKN